MRKFRILFATLVVFSLVLSSLMASPSTWAWRVSDQSSEVSEEPAEILTEEPAKSMKESESSKGTSKNPEFVIVPYDEYVAAIADIETGNELNKKGKTQVVEATEALKAAVNPFSIKKMNYFATLDAEHGFGPNDLKLGVSLGFIFKDCLIGSVGVMKTTDFTSWMDRSEYTGRVSLGIVF